MTPYNTGKVQIGIAYQRKPLPDYDPDMQRIQAAFVGRNPRLASNHRADLTNAITEAVLWTLSAALIVAIPYTPTIWKFFAA